eukprot:7272962-Alexandrium_andersonii.AAC.1
MAKVSVTLLPHAASMRATNTLPEKPVQHNANFATDRAGMITECVFKTEKANWPARGKLAKAPWPTGQVHIS